MQYREELLSAVSDVYNVIENRKNKILNQIQTHAVTQIKEGYTAFRISKLKKADEKYLKEWADITNAKVRVIKFRCFDNAKKYVVKQFVVDLKGSAELDYELEGKTLIIDVE